MAVSSHRSSKILTLSGMVCHLCCTPYELPLSLLVRPAI